MRKPGSVPVQMQLVRDEWQVAVSKIGHLEIGGESVVFIYGPRTVEALQPDGGITVEASFGKSFTFESDGKVLTLISSISVSINKSPPAWLSTASGGPGISLRTLSVTLTSPKT